MRAVLVFGGEAVSLAEVDFFDWERLVDHYRRVDSANHQGIRTPDRRERAGAVGAEQ